MDEQSTRLGTTPTLREVPKPENPAAEVTRLRTDIEDARDGLGVYVSELDRRRHDAFDLRLQLKKHKALAIGVGVAAAAVGVGVVFRSRRRNTVQNLPWSPWRVAPEVTNKARGLGRLLLSTALPVALKAARGFAERAASRRPRTA